MKLHGVIDDKTLAQLRRRNARRLADAIKALGPRHLLATLVQRKDSL
jgi:lipoate synthase